MSVSVRYLLLAALLGAAGPAYADGDAVAGKKVFNRCMACHAADKPTNKVGPHLAGIVGRPVASVADFKGYSDAMKAKGASGAVWDEAALTAYITDPKGYIPGNNMAFSGLKKPDDIANVIAYMKSVAPK